MKFNIATWNCFGMGQSIFDVITYLRAPFSKRFSNSEVISQCAEPNILCVQEILSHASQNFFDTLGKKFFSSSVRDHNKFKLVSLRGSGLGVTTRAVTLKTKLLNFKNRGISWDKYARKGALYLQLELDREKKIDLLTVHLQAGQGELSRKVRAEQLAELRRWIAELGSRERSFIVCGDFNIDALNYDQNEYQTLKNMLDGFIDLGQVSNLPTYHPHRVGNPLAHAFEKESPPQRIDYIFMRSDQLVMSDFKRLFDRPIASLGQGIRAWASDHYGLMATLEIPV